MTNTELRLREALVAALDVLYRDAGALVESCSLLERLGEDDSIPREGTFDANVRSEIDELLAVIRRIEAEGVRPTAEQPAWLIAIVEGRREL